VTRRIWGVLGLGLCACATQPDIFAVAERALLAQDLPAALVAFDAVPVEHPNYPEARAAALGVERRMRRSHELVLEGLLLRGEWLDEEALAPLQRAQAIWPRMPGLDALIAATGHRAGLLGAERSTAGTSPAIVRVEPGGEGATAAGLPGAPVQEPAAIPVLPAPLPAPPAVVADEVPRHEDPVALGLVAVESKLAHGDLEAAVVDLIELAKRFPDEARIGSRLARVLHQRALMRYGLGQLAAAITDWERVVALDPRNALAAGLLLSARAETSADAGLTRPGEAGPQR
jgi:hypothetical protein